jgi:hypothetical protein
MNDRMEHGRAERLSALAAVEAALADPVRLVELLQEAGDDADVVRRVADAFSLDAQQAESVLAVQLSGLTPGRHARLADELRVLRARWGPPIEGQVTSGPGAPPYSPSTGSNGASPREEPTASSTCSSGTCSRRWPGLP